MPIPTCLFPLVEVVSAFLTRFSVFVNLLTSLPSLTSANKGVKACLYVLPLFAT